ncbi:MAG: CoB--CoM heterodisulfide reductase iron-sulfur subunit A family protein [Deltaproteobacteria bacterium]|nr:CoB--CoM heterodisulfide reductase iron-sulfur subunit A family protein [Deltaproteobacteria bacterium]
MNDNGKKLRSVLVAGAGVGGVHAALNLADLGFKVYLVDKQANIGGKLVQLYRTAEDNFALGMITPVLLEAVNNPNIEIMPLGELERVEGEPGALTAWIKRTPRYVDPLQCVTCGLCWRACPVGVPSEFNYGLGSRKAIYMPYAGAVPNKPSIDPGTCLHLQGQECTKCADVCPTNAIHLDQKESMQKLEVGAVILSPGMEPFLNSAEAKELGYGSMADVIDNFQMDRLVSIYGPTQGQVTRPSDGTIAKRIAFIQCVGSRKPDHDLEYCSSVCCMHAIRSALSVMAKDEENEITIFHNDIMALSKPHERVYAEAQDKGIHFMRAQVLSITEDPDTKELTIEYISEAGKKNEQGVFDLVVLSLGLIPSQDGIEVAKRLGVPLNPWQFPVPSDHSNMAAPGIAVGASFRSLGDIPEAVADTQAAAMEVADLLAGAEPEAASTAAPPPERDVRGIPARVGVYVCECGGIISKTVDTGVLAGFSAELDGVVETLTVPYACYQEGIDQIKKSIQDNEVNRVVFVGCSYRSHLPKIQNLIRGVGLNKFLVEMVNARELAAWVHIDEKQGATERIKEEIKGVVAKVKALEPLPVYTRDVKQRGLVIGGGIAGMVAAQGIASQGIPVDIVERTDQLGGNALRLSHEAGGERVSKYLATLKKEVADSPLIRVLLKSRLRDMKGRVGQFHATIQTPEGDSDGEYGAIIVATGGREYSPHEYLYGSNENVVTQLELEELIAKGGSGLKDIKSAVVIHCVGSRTPERPFCSRVCCTQAVKNTLRLKEMNPNITIHHLHRDIRTYFLHDILYQRARKEGVAFIRYDEEKGLQVSQDNGLAIRFSDSSTYEDLELKPDLLVLNAAVVPGEDNKALSHVLGVPLGEYGFFDEEDYMTFTPVTFSKKGIFLCGLAHGPKPIDESIAQARAAAMRALAVLSKEKLTHQAVYAEVSPGKCIACLTCVRVCPFGVPFINDDGVAEIVPLECRACGVCVSSCPNDAIELKSFTDSDVIPHIETMFA